MTNFPASDEDPLTGQVASLATIRADGFPHVTEVWFLHHGGELKLSLNASRLKTRNLSDRSSAPALPAPARAWAHPCGATSPALSRSRRGG
jgi:hypothetical protein